jgi:hypothetical protein
MDVSIVYNTRSFLHRLDARVGEQPQVDDGVHVYPRMEPWKRHAVARRAWRRTRNAASGGSSTTCRQHATYDGVHMQARAKRWRSRRVPDIGDDMRPATARRRKQNVYYTYKERILLVLRLHIPLWIWYSLCFYLPCVLGLVKVKLYKIWPNILKKVPTSRI